MHSPHLSGELWTISLRVEYLHKLFWTPVMQNLSLLLPRFIYLVIYLYECGLMDVSLILWVIIPILLYFFAQFILASAIGNFFSWFLCPFYIPPSLWWVVWFFRFWAFSYILGLQVHFYIFYMALILAIFPRNPGLFVCFYWRIVLETKIWALGVLIVLGPFSWYCKEIYVYILISTHLYL